MEISSFNTSVPKIMIICYTVPEIRRLTDAIFIFHLGLFFALLAPRGGYPTSKSSILDWTYFDYYLR